MLAFSFDCESSVSVPDGWQLIRINADMNIYRIDIGRVFMFKLPSAGRRPLFVQKFFPMNIVSRNL